MVTYTTLNDNNIESIFYGDIKEVPNSVLENMSVIQGTFLIIDIYALEPSVRISGNAVVY